MIGRDILDLLEPILVPHGFEYQKTGVRFRRKVGNKTDSIHLRLNSFGALAFNLTHWDRDVQKVLEEVTGYKSPEVSSWTIFHTDLKTAWAIPQSKISPQKLNTLIRETFLPWFERMNDRLELRKELESRNFPREWRTICAIDKVLNDKIHVEQFLCKFFEWLSDSDLSNQTTLLPQYAKFHEKYPEFFCEAPTIKPADDARFKAEEDAIYQAAADAALSGKGPVYSQNYYVRVMLGAPSSPDLWTNELLIELMTTFDFFLKRASGAAEIRLARMELTGNGQFKKFHEKKFRISLLSEKLKEFQVGQFYAADIFAPSTKICEREHSIPDILIKMRNSLSNTSMEVDLPPTLIVSVRHSIFALAPDEFMNCFREISKTLHPVLDAELVRPYYIGGAIKSSLINMPLALFRFGQIPYIYGAKLESLYGPWKEVTLDN